ncbi:MAG TPA: imidazolonepropionase, partial [Rhizobiales bacterium]|nr:imidazolonepropionase [Hyphomicrobiales bacterium]
LMDADYYIDEVCIPTLKKAHQEGIVDAVDGFCESIGFSPLQISRVFEVASKLGLPVKVHAEQLSQSGGIHLATQFGALSADHIEYASRQNIVEMSEAGTVAVLLPGAFYTLNETQKPPVAALREHAVPMALATDWNPGSSPLGSLLLAMNMACTLFQLTPQEALAGTTRNAARALGFKDRGMIRVGLRPDFAIWDVENPAELSCQIGFNSLYKRIFGGLP